MITCFGENRSSNLKILFPLEVILIDLVLKVINAKGNYSKQIVLLVSRQSQMFLFLQTSFICMVLLSRNQNDRVIRFFITGNITSEALANVNLEKETLNIFNKINLRSKKWLISFPYKT